MKKLSSSFFLPDTEIVAKNLLGKVIKVGDKY
jgi:3-methyladenine DNA glycosylase Mpg